MLVVATAGHVDHGKSSLVLALTGTDPDRWEEEKRRGLTIDLGFAFTRLPAGHDVGFVDVPGHVRFLKNMLAGAGAVRAAILVVAAREGWMPQTEEHLRILELLGVDRGFTVVTMADAVDAETLETASLEAALHLEGSFLDGAPIVACDSLSGRGIPDVVAALEVVAAGTPGADDRGRPRLWVDRAFTAKGAGTIVTGTLTGGSLHVGDAVVVHPLGTQARVRGLQSGHADADAVGPGSRVAVNLADVAHDRIARGDALTGLEGWHVTDVVDGRLSLLGAAPGRRTRVKAYVGSGEHDAALSDLGDGFARVALPHPLPLAPGDRLLLRDPGPGVTLGACEVLDVDPARRPAAARTRLPLPLSERILDARPVCSADDLARLGGLGADEARALADNLMTSGLAEAAGDALVATAEAARVRLEVGAALDRHHRDHPLDEGLDLARIEREVGVATTVIAALVDPAEVVVTGQRARRPGHVASPADDPEGRRYLQALAAGHFEPPSPAEAGVNPGVARALARAGEVVEVEGAFWHPDAYADALAVIEAALAEHGELSVGDLRDALGSSRKHVLPLLAHLDAQGVTRRRGDVRVGGPRLAGAGEGAG